MELFLIEEREYIIYVYIYIYILVEICEIVRDISKIFEISVYRSFSEIEILNIYINMEGRSRFDIGFLFMK